MFKKILLIILTILLCTCTPSKVAIQEPESPHVVRSVEWKELNRANMLNALEEHRLVMFYFYKEECGACKKIDNSTFKSPCVMEQLEKGYVPIRVDVDKQPDFAISMLEEKVVPSIMFSLPTGDVFPFTIKGYPEPILFCKVLKRIKLEVDDAIRKSH